MTSRSRITCWAGISIGLVTATIWGIWLWLPVAAPSTATLRLEAEQAENSGDLARAAVITDRFLTFESHDQGMLLRAIRVAIKQNKLQQAIGYLATFSTSVDQEKSVAFSDEAVSTLSLAADALLQAGYVDSAENCLRHIALYSPSALRSTPTRLGYLLSCEGRRWEAVPHLVAQLKLGQTSFDHLLWLGNLQAIVGDEALLETWNAVDPAGLGPRLATAIRKLAEHDPRHAAEILIPLAEVHPDCVEIGVQLGKAALELGQLDRPSDEMRLLRQRTVDSFLRWHGSNRVRNRDSHPDLWVLRGRWFSSKRDLRAATRCFAEALRLNPDQQYANYQLAQLLQRDSQSAIAKKCIERAEKLSELFRIINLLYDNRNHVDLLRQAAEQTESLGRLWEAWGWYRIALTVDPKAEWAWDNSSRLRKRLDAGLTERVLPESYPIAGLELANYPLPDWHKLNEPPFIVSQDVAPEVTEIQFEERSRDAGLDFTYFNSPHDGSGERTFEFTGGGIGVLDFDADGWPDLYFTQGCSNPAQSVPQPQRDFLDRLYRNMEGQRLVDVTSDCGIAEDHFSQGVTVGDFDADGFPDLYVANIGPNRFFRNNGDGTFDDVTPTTGTAGDSWSTSCVMVDLNADGLPDLYVVNYLAGDEVFTRVCQESDGSPRLCYPQVFPSSADLLYINNGNGTYQESTRLAGIHDVNGRGLGVVAADFEGTGRLGLFVANDTTANFYFRNNSQQPGGIPTFAEEGISSGLAFDASGQAQASMGVAAADVDHDGRLDLFVTNFEREYNNLYLQSATGLFTDSISHSGLQDPGYLMLGFGTQFLDADLDGWSDLFVANGHIDDFTRKGIPYRMPPQFFRHVGNGIFRELPAAGLGRYFGGKYLGRAVARLDWNRDGLDDLAIGHLDSPSLLLTNRTPAIGRFLSLQFRGIVSSRDAIGTRIELRIGDQIRQHQLTAGDGYQSSNERRLVMGAGHATQIDQIIVTWPSGLRQSFENLSTNTQWTVIEGVKQLIRHANDL